MQAPRIIGLSGTNGAGKDAVGLFLAAKHDYLFVSVSELLRDELKRRGVSVERQNLHSLSAEWRREFGLAVLVDRAVAAFEQTDGKYAGVVMASLRNPFEADRVHELGGTMLWVDADPRVRYDRVRNAARGRGGEDNKTFEQFLAEEQAEMHNASGDSAALDMAAVKDRSDITLMNNGSDMATFEHDIEQVLNLSSSQDMLAP